jgi:hypothetical protein
MTHWQPWQHGHWHVPTAAPSRQLLTRRDCVCTDRPEPSRRTVCCTLFTLYHEWAAVSTRALGLDVRARHVRGMGAVRMFCATQI